jgi:hypothetical protein
MSSSTIFLIAMREEEEEKGGERCPEDGLVTVVQGKRIISEWR